MNTHNAAADLATCRVARDAALAAYRAARADALGAALPTAARNGYFEALGALEAAEAALKRLAP